jgi:hypothetical protein
VVLFCDLVSNPHRSWCGCPYNDECDDDNDDSNDAYPYNCGERGNDRSSGNF